MTATAHHIPAAAVPESRGFGSGYVYWCIPCRLSSTPTTVRADTAALAVTHEHLHHATAATTVIAHTDQPIPFTLTDSWCEACRVEPATTVWAHPAAGTPFTLCTPCAATLPCSRPSTGGAR